VSGEEKRRLQETARVHGAFACGEAMGLNGDGHLGTISSVKEREQIHRGCGGLRHKVGGCRGLTGGRRNGGGGILRSRDTASVRGSEKLDNGPGKVFRGADDAMDSAGAANEPSDNNGVPSTDKWPGGTAESHLRRHAVDVYERGPLGLGLGTAVRPVRL
jgi:hypothetical protein